MPFKLILLASAVLVLAACGSDPEESADSAQADTAPPSQQADNSGAGGGDVLVISPRTYTGGSVKAKVTGFFEVDGSQSLNQPASITDESQTWLQYGASGAPELNVLFTNSQDMEENGVNIGVGPYTVTATSTSGECQTRFDITPTTVSGHYSCTGSMGYNKESGQMGRVDIEVDFDAKS